jgi:hypothetical protein
MDNSTYVITPLGSMLIERILIAEGHLCPESIMSLTGCNRAMAEHLQNTYEAKEDAA